MAYLLTQTLLSAWDYMHTCHESCAEDAKKDFLDTLNRVRKDPTDAMRNGIRFETEVYSELAGLPRDEIPEWESGIKAAAGVLEGAQIQVRVSRNLTLGNMEFRVYGILDALKAGVIYDVKFSNTQFGSCELAGKYLGKPQHSTYLYLVPEAREFTYVVSDGEDLYTETYTRKNTRPLEEIVGEFVDSLVFMGLHEVYLEKWRC